MPSGSRITIRLAPPGRTSSWACEMVQGLGTNHWGISAASVQQRYSLAAGASIRRVSTRSNGWAAGAGGAVSLGMALAYKGTGEEGGASRKRGAISSWKG